MSARPVFTPGWESNHNGRWLEHIIEDEARARGVLIQDYRDQNDNQNLFDPVVLIRRVPYKNLYGTESTSEFVLQFYERRIRIECRVQESSGSVDEKFPFLYLNGRHHMDEDEVIFVLHGDGPRHQAVTWFKHQCETTEAKTLRVFNVSDYRKWFRDLFKAGGR